MPPGTPAPEDLRVELGAGNKRQDDCAETFYATSHVASTKSMSSTAMFASCASMRPTT
jgi:hypothetical protein